MATRQMKAMTEVGNHEVGNINSWKIRTLPYGAKVVGADVDNFTLVELGFDSEGNRTCKQLSDVTKKSYLIAAPEQRFNNEQLVDFYNAVGEDVRVVILDEGVRFDTSAYSLNTGVTDVVTDLVAHFDPTSKKFILSTAGSAHADYTNAKAKFLVVNSEDDLVYLCGKPTVRLEVQES